MEFVCNLNYRIDKTDFNEILEWGNLRNALVHYPPEEYTPGLLNENDVKEYVALAKKVLNYLIEQKQTELK